METLPKSFKEDYWGQQRLWTFKIKISRRKVFQVISQMQNSGSTFAFTKLFFPICNKGSLSLGPCYFLCILQKPTEEAKAVLISSPPCTRLVDIPTEAVSFLRDPWQNDKWEHTNFSKVNSETTAVSHLKRSFLEATGADGGKGAPGRKSSAARVHFPCRHRSVALLSSTAQLSKSSERR